MRHRLVYLKHYLWSEVMYYKVYNFGKVCMISLNAKLKNRSILSCVLLSNISFKDHTAIRHF